MKFVDENGLHNTDEINGIIHSLSKEIKTRPNAIVLESIRSLETATRFLALLKAGRNVLMLPPEEFRNPGFMAYVKSVLGPVSLWPVGESIFEADEDDKVHRSLRSKSGFIVRTSGTSGMMNKFILHDPELFMKKFAKKSPTFQRTLNFFPPDSIVGIETLMEAQVHDTTIINTGIKNDPEVIVGLLKKEKIDLLHITPTFMNLLLASGSFDTEALQHVDCLAFGSEPAQKTVLARMLGLKPSLKLLQIYGMSEIGLQSTLPVKEDPTSFILDSQLNPYRISGGILEMKSETPMVTYLNNDQKVEEGWFLTGDVVSEDHGRLKVIGRSDDVINVAGKKFHPIQLEELIMEMEGVDDVMITAESHELIGQAVIAHVSTAVPEENFRISFRDYLEKNVPGFMRPQRLVLNSRPVLSSRMKKRRKSTTA